MSKRDRVPENQLWLDFEKSRQNFHTAADELVAACERLIRNHPGDLPETPAVKTAKRVKNTASSSSVEIHNLRERLTDIVRIHARRHHLHWQEIWRILYDRLWKETGFDANVRAIAKGIKPIDAVSQSGHLPRLLQIAAAL
jgi:hypothetical protein